MAAAAAQLQMKTADAKATETEAAAHLKAAQATKTGIEAQRAQFELEKDATAHGMELGVMAAEQEGGIGMNGA